jgi:hypothetical protein
MRIVFVDARSSADWRSFARFVVKTNRAILRSTAQRGAFGLDAPLLQCWPFVLTRKSWNTDAFGLTGSQEKAGPCPSKIVFVQSETRIYHQKTEKS